MKKIIAAVLFLAFCAALPAPVLADKATEQSWLINSAVPESSGDEESFSFLYFGDIQITQSAAADYAAWAELARGALGRSPGAAFALQGGDIVESGIDRAQWESFFSQAGPALGGMPFFPTNGNHESNFLGGKPELYLELFELPENGPPGFTEEFYSFDYANTHVIVLNSWVFSGEQPLTEDDYSAIDEWIADDLARSDATWKIAVTHIPVYAVHSDVTSNEVRARWAPVFERYGLDVCFVGHQHVYSRLMPLTDGVEDNEDGVTYIMGNSGLKFYDSADESLAERTIYNVPTYQLAGVDGDILTVQTFDADGDELDFVSLRPRGSKTLTRGGFVEDFLPDAELLGYGDGNLGLGDAITNEQIAILLRRDAASPEDGRRAADDSAYDGNADAGGASEWACDAWEWAVRYGIFPDAAPRAVATRAGAARAYNAYNASPGY
ncbi:MAG: metallophosphoesterase [Oscillospiraceae bacterium]|jgi:hypothetical protein|nr:metallophosphoesterase [Oscillospiraceae bacterium]